MRTKAVSALLCFSVAVGDKTLTRNNLEKKIYFILYFQVTTVHHRKKPEQEPGAGTWDRDKGTMPTGLLAMPFSAYFLTPPMTTHPGPTGPSDNNHQSRKCSHRHADKSA